MINQIILTWPVADHKKSAAFLTALGPAHNQQFSDDTAACIYINDIKSVMLGTRENFVRSPRRPAATQVRRRTC